jgi:hypothetical protein
MLLALIHAHGKNIVHRDIKPDNVFLLNQSGVRLHVRVLDFGIARIFRRDDPSSSDTITNPGAVLGTPRYMSPEQLAGRPVDARSDLYSAALVLHEALTGHLPYVSGKKLCELCPEAPPTLQALLDHCLKPNPEERPPSAVEVYLRLQDMGKASGILLLPPGAMDKLIAARQAAEPTVTYVGPEDPKRKRRRRLLLGGILLLVLTAAAALALYFRPVPAPPTPSQETLLGIKVGDSREVVWQHLNRLNSRGRGNPWKGGTPEYLGHALRTEDLQLAPDDLEKLEVQQTPDHQTYVLFREEVVRALVTKHPGAATGRSVKLGDTVGNVYEKYDGEEPEIKSIDIPITRRGTNPLDLTPLSSGVFAFGLDVPPPKSKPKKKAIHVHRYDTLGIAFEIDGSHVSAITLYPAVKAP